MAGDGVDDHRLQRLGQIVTHVGDEKERGPGDQLGRTFTTRRREKCVVSSVDHEGRNVEIRQPLGASATRVDRGQLPGRSLGIERSIERTGRLRLHSIGIEVAT